jgi:hypothetical protein
MTADLRALLEERQREHERLKQAGHIIPQVFFRLVAQGRGGELRPKRIIEFDKAWDTACAAAGVPGRIVHDMRRSGRAEPRARRDSRARGDADDRSPDPLSVRAVQHRERQRSARGCAEARCRPEESRKLLVSY